MFLLQVWNLVMTDETALELMEFSPEEALINLMKETNTTGVSKALGLTAELVRGNDKSTMSFVEKGLLESLLHILSDRTGIYDEGIYVGVYHCLFQVAECEESAGKVLDMFLEKLENECANTSTGNYRAKNLINSLGTITQLTVWHKTRKIIIERETWKLFVKFLTHDTPMIRSFACTGCWNISLNDEGLFKLAEMNPTPNLLRAVSLSDKKSLMMNALGVVSKLFDEELFPNVKLKFSIFRELGYLPMLLVILSNTQEIGEVARAIVEDIYFYDPSSTLYIASVLGFNLRKDDERALAPNHLSDLKSTLEKANFSDSNIFFQSLDILWRQESCEKPTFQIMKAMYLFHIDWKPDTHKLFHDQFKSEVLTLFLLQKRRLPFFSKIVLWKVCHHLSKIWSSHLVKSLLLQHKKTE